MTRDSQSGRTVPVLVPMPAERPYSYAVPEGEHAPPGSIVRVPLGPREVAGIVRDVDGWGVGRRAWVGRSAGGRGDGCERLGIRAGRRCRRQCRRVHLSRQ